MYCGVLRRLAGLDLPARECPQRVPVPAPADQHAEAVGDDRKGHCTWAFRETRARHRGPGAPRHGGTPTAYPTGQSTAPVDTGPSGARRPHRRSRNGSRRPTASRPPDMAASAASSYLAKPPDLGGTVGAGRRSAGMLWKLDTRAGLWPGNQAHAVVAGQRLDPGNRERATVNHHHREALQQVAGHCPKVSRVMGSGVRFSEAGHGLAAC